MIELLVAGYYGFQNAGDEAILGGIIRSVRALEPGVRFTVLSGDPAGTARLHGTNAVPRMDVGAIWRAIGQADAVLVGGGSLLQDVTSRRNIPYYLGICQMALLRQRPVMWCAQGIGPVRRPESRLLVRWLGNRMRAITLRDDESAQTLTELGVRQSTVQITADAALSLPPGNPRNGAALLRQAGVPAGLRVAGVALRPWPHMANYEETMAAALDRVAADMGGGIVFVPMQVQQDKPVAEAVRRHMEAPNWVLSGDLGFQQVLDVVAALDLLIGLRYHALVFAAMCGVPLVGLSYDPKIDSFLAQLGLKPAGSPEALDSTALIEAAHIALSGREQMSAALRSLAQELALRSRENARIALALVGR